MSQPTRREFIGKLSRLGAAAAVVGSGVSASAAQGEHGTALVPATKSDGGAISYGGAIPPETLQELIGKIDQFYSAPEYQVLKEGEVSEVWDGQYRYPKTVMVLDTREIIRCGNPKTGFIDSTCTVEAIEIEQAMPPSMWRGVVAVIIGDTVFDLISISETDNFPDGDSYKYQRRLELVSRRRITWYSELPFGAHPVAGDSHRPIHPYATEQMEQHAEQVREITKGSREPKRATRPVEITVDLRPL